MSRSRKLPIFKDKGLKGIYHRIVKRRIKNYLKSNFLRLQDEDFDCNIPNPKTKVDRTIYSIKTLTEVEMPVYRLFRPKLINYEGLVPYVDTFYIFDSTCGELLTDAKIFRLQTTEGNLIHI
jgi:hypothetical protein